MSWCCFNTVLEKEEIFSHSEVLPGLAMNVHLKQFTYNQLVSATNNFHLSNKIGRGGFGTVFKGALKDGTQIAAKVLSVLSRQGINEFMTEIIAITSVKHPNLVELIGYCTQGSTRILVYEFLEKGSLDHALMSQDSETTLDWSKRSSICIGTARALQFLHEEVVPHIVHRDIKSSNILLDRDLVPKIGDFGLAKLFPDNVTHLSTRVAGTTGYLAPEYIMGGKLTKKADIYSFGVLILEIISGTSGSKATNSGTEFLLEMAWKLHEEGKLIELVDSHLKEYPDEEALKYLKVALFCTQGAANRRPSISQVLEMLSNRIRLDVKDLIPPGLVQDMLKINKGSKPTNSSNSHHSITPVSISELIPR